MMELSEEDVAANPLRQFQIWFHHALNTCQFEPNAMTLATVGRGGKPSARQLLLKDYDKDGFCFYSNYRSRKGRELKDNNKGALLFYWPDLERQIRIEGTVKKLSAKESDRYFQSRPRGGQIGAWASYQSETLESREELEARAHKLTIKFKGKKIPRPPYWGGFRLVPNQFEFWQGRPNRLHDRICYKKSGIGWRRSRLSP